MPFSRGKTRFFCIINKQPKKTKQKDNKNK